MKKSLAQFEEEYLASEGGRDKIAGMRRALDVALQRSVVIEMPDEVFRFGVIGDTHNGSRYERPKELAAYYSLCEKRGIKDVLHAGDCLDGHRLYKGQEFEVFKLGWDEQSSHWAEVTPRKKGITTHFITGNHDDSLKKLAGINVGEGLASLRPDHKFIGATIGRVQFKKGKRVLNAMLLHPGGGSAYALSYRPQKIVEQIEGGTKPDLLCIGNYHKAEFMPAYRNVAVCQVGCFQAQTPFMLEKGISAHCGGWLFEVGIGKGCNTFKAEFFAFY